MGWRVAGVVVRPRKTMAAVTARPAWAAVWLGIVSVWAACGAGLVSTPVGRQALVDERVRLIEAFGGTVDDIEYARLQSRPPWHVYLTSGGRILLTPPVTLLAALGLWLAARPTPANGRGVSSRRAGEIPAKPPEGREGGDDAEGSDGPGRDGVRDAPVFRQSLAVSVHASVVLVLGQLIATPLHYVRESLTNPLNLASVLPFMYEGTLPARMFGAIDLFALWWIWLLAVGGAAMTHPPKRGFLGRVLAFYFGIAAVLAVAQVMSGGS